jgi:hypothetical protein
MILSRWFKEFIQFQDCNEEMEEQPPGFAFWIIV